MTGGRVFVLAALLTVAAAGMCVAAPLTILYTNDLHLRFARLPSIQAVIDAERAEGDPLLLLDGGDAWQDTRNLYALVSGADRMVGWMNRVGYDAAALGNHEMYWGADRLDELVALAEFPVLNADLRPNGRWESPLDRYRIIEVGGLRVLLTGVVTPYHLPYPDFPWLTHVDPVGAIQSVLAEVERGFDLLIVVGHVSVRAARTIARAIPEVDVFVTGHSHEETPDPIRVGTTLIVQAGAFARKMGRLRLDVADGVASVVSNELLPTETASVERDRGRQALVGVVLALLAATLLVLL